MLGTEKEEKLIKGGDLQADQAMNIQTCPRIHIQ